jgi:hypothetical protein
MITGGLCRAAQVFVFHSEGYPAQVELESGDLPLGESRSIRRIAWDADVPAGTRIAVETQTGNGFQTVKRYYLKNGKEVADLRAYESQKSRNQGPIVEEEVRDESWTSWSEPRRTSGQAFSSPSPRRWLRVRVRLISDDPEAMPTLRSLTFVARDPVISAGLSGGILPREAALDSLQEFLFTIRPVGFSARDPGFDQVVIALPAGSAGAEFAGVTVRGREIDARAEVRNDSLVVQLPPPAVRRDSVEIRFRARLYQSPSVFSTVVGNSALPESGQGVAPERFGANQVFVPEAVTGGGLIRRLTHSGMVTPNADGVNDEYRLSFTIVKTDRRPRVRIFALDGTQMAELASVDEQLGKWRYVWDGRRAGITVPPGIYLALIEVGADARDETASKLIHVVY